MISDRFTSRFNIRQARAALMCVRTTKGGSMLKRWEKRKGTRWSQERSGFLVMLGLVGPYKDSVLEQNKIGSLQRLEMRCDMIQLWVWRWLCCVENRPSMAKEKNKDKTGSCRHNLGGKWWWFEPGEGGWWRNRKWSNANVLLWLPVGKERGREESRSSLRFLSK